MATEIQEQVEHSVIAFYGSVCGPEAIEDVYNYSLSIFTNLDLRPDLMGTDLDRGRLIRHEKSAQKLKTRGFGGVTCFSVCTLSKGANNELEGTTCSIVYTTGQDLILNLESSVWSIGSAAMLEAARQFCSLINPAYGIGFRRPFGLGPTYYAMNLATVGVDKAERLRISWWQEARERKLYRAGMLRDVYPWNFLNASQLAARVGDLSLEKWIRHDARRGTLAPFAGELTLWEVPDQDIPFVRQVLYDAGVIFDYERDWIERLRIAENQGYRGEDALRAVLATYGLASPPEPPMVRHQSMDVQAATPEEAVAMALKAFGFNAPDEVDILQTEGEGKVKKLNEKEKADLFPSGKKRKKQS